MPCGWGMEFGGFRAEPKKRVGRPHVDRKKQKRRRSGR